MEGEGMVGRADRGTERQTDRKPVRKEVPAAAAKEVVKTIWQRRKKQWWSAGTPATLRVCGTIKQKYRTVSPHPHAKKKKHR